MSATTGLTCVTSVDPAGGWRNLRDSGPVGVGSDVMIEYYSEPGDNGDRNSVFPVQDLDDQYNI